MPYPVIVDAAVIAAASGGKISATDPRVQIMLDGATAAVRHYCGWHVTPVITETLTLDSEGERRLPMPSLRVTEITEIRINGSTVTGWRMSQRKAMVEFPHPLPFGYATIEVDLSHGFDAAPDLAQVITQTVIAGLASPMGATSESAGDLSVSWSQTAPGVAGGLSLLQRDLSILDVYRIGGRP